MRTASVVVGAGYGDEGKGLATDWLCARHEADVLAVRFNGGAQAGHTVQTPDGQRHVFSHFASGTLAGADTYLSRYFVCHPMLFTQEREALREKGFRPRVAIDPQAR